MAEHRRTAFEQIAEEQNHRRGRRRAARKRRPVQRLLPLLLVLVVVGGLVAGGVMGYRWFTGSFSVEQEATDYPGPGSGEVVITVSEGDTGSDIATTLVEHDVILSRGPFISAFQADPDAGAVQPGKYRLKQRMTSSDALDMLLDSANDAGTYITVPEGLRMSQIFPILSEATDIPVEDFEAAAKDYTALGIPENPANSAEGYLFPARYEVPEDPTAKGLLTTMWERTEQELNSAGIPQEEWHRTLTLASIAEKEAATEQDYGRVVRTLENRLAGVGEAGGSPMPLQLDSTITYISGAERVSTTPEERAVDSPYNTYKNPGLPVGPISNPGAATIEAAANPPEGDWLYWVTVNTDTGETRFAETHAEHEKNVAAWRAWARENNG